MDIPSLGVDKEGIEAYARIDKDPYSVTWWVQPYAITATQGPIGVPTDCLVRETGLNGDFDPISHSTTPYVKLPSTTSTFHIPPSTSLIKVGFLTFE